MKGSFMWHEELYVCILCCMVSHYLRKILQSNWFILGQHEGALNQSLPYKKVTPKGVSNVTEKHCTGY